MTITAKQTQIIHVAKARLRLEDEEYRALLQQVAGVQSSRDLTAAGFTALMNRFERMGFSSSPAGNGFGIRPGMASPRQIDLIRDLWREFKGDDANDQTLGRWLERTFSVSSIRFLGYEAAAKAIGALKIMKARNFDRPPESAGSDTPKTGGRHVKKRSV